MSDYIIGRVTDFAETLLPSMGLELVEVQFRREQHGWVLRVFIDTEEGVTHEHCKMVSRELGDYLDVEDIIENKYHLEISSPGLERKVRNLQEFERFCGRKAKVKLIYAIDEQKTYIGEIAQVEGETIVLVDENGKTVKFSMDMVNSARLAI